MEAQGLNLNTIPKDDAQITLRKVCNFSQGGELERIEIENTHPDYKLIIKAIGDTIGIQYYGVDIIADDLSIKPTKQNCGINEINHGPSQRIHYSADLKENRPFWSTKKLLNEIFNDQTILT